MRRRSHDKEIGGTTVYGVGYPTDRETQAKLTAAALFAQVDNMKHFSGSLPTVRFPRPCRPLR